MSLVIAIAATVLLVFQLSLLARVVLDWSVVLAGPSMPGSVRQRLSNGIRAVTEPVLRPVRRVLPPLRLGQVSLDTAFIAVFIGVVVLRQVVLSL